MTSAARDRHDEKAIAFFGSWMVFGLFLDGWAHGAEKPETFFSPWHFILYSGFGAAVMYFVFRERVLKKRSNPDRLTTAGLVLFIVGAVGDGIWHEIFGIEVDLEALLSPTHLALMTGGLLMLGAAYRAAYPRRDEARAYPSLVVTMTLCAAVIAFFTQYLNAFDMKGLYSQRGEDLWQVHTVASVLATNAIFLGLTFLLVRRWTTSRWTFTCVYTALAALLVGLQGASGALPHIAAMAVAGFATDVLVARLDPHSRLFSALVPLAIWGAWFGSIQLQDGVHWAAELWTGTIILAVMEGLGLGLLAFPGARDEPAPPNETRSHAGSVDARRADG